MNSIRTKIPKIPYWLLRKMSICSIHEGYAGDIKEEFDELWDRNKGLAPVIQVRDSIYLNWRYQSIPGFNYRSFAIMWNGRLSGYIVIRLMNLMGHYFGVLVDFFPFPVVDEAITKCLFGFARDYCKSHGAEFLTCLMSRAGAPFLKKTGLRKIPEKLNPRRWCFGCRCRETDGPLLQTIKHWYITYGDSDIV